MKRINESTDDDELIAVYARAAIDQGTAKSVRKANRSSDMMLRIARILQERGPESQTKLLPLLRHPDPRVRLWAAAYALTFAPESAEPVLQDLAAESPSAAGPRGTVRFDAKMTLQEWHKGGFTFF